MRLLEFRTKLGKVRDDLCSSMDYGHRGAISMISNDDGCAHEAARGTRGTVFVLDDDRLVRDLLTKTLRSAGYVVQCFGDRAGLLTAAISETPACILLDVCVPLDSGLGVLAELRQGNYYGPILMMSGRSDIPTAVSAIRLGADDFIEKPFQASEITERVTMATRESVCAQAGLGMNIKAVEFPGRELLTSREQDVLELLLTGATSKETGRVLGINSRTIEDHRTNIVRKLKVRNSADVVRLVLGVRVKPPLHR